MNKLNSKILIAIITISIFALAYLSYLAGYKVSENKMDSLLMTMTLDSNLVTAGLYEELPNNVRKTFNFYLQDTPAKINNIKIFAEVKYITIDNKEVKIDQNNIWNLLKSERVFQRRFEINKEPQTNNDYPVSPYAENLTK